MDKKLGEYKAFSWDSNEAWSSYLRNVELPGADAATALQRLKARWYKRNIDPDFEVDWVMAPPKPAAQPQPSPSPAGTSRPAAAAAATGATAGGGSSGSAPRAFSGWGWGAGSAGGGPTSTRGPAALQRNYLLLLQLAMMVTGLFHLFPFLPISNCSLQCYWWFMRLAAVSQGYKVWLKFGTPPVWPFNWPALQMWLGRAMASTDFFYFITSFAFMTTRMGFTMAMVPSGMAALLDLLAAGQQQLGHLALWQRTGARAHAWVTSRPALVRQASTWAELSLGFLLIVLLLTPSRNLLLLFFYWNMLKFRYVAPESAAEHRMAWAYLDQRTVQIRQRLPMLERVVQYAKAWFLNVR